MDALTPEQHTFLRSGKNFGVVATVGEDGRPQTSVVWVDSDGEHVRFNTTNKRAKGRNLRRDPRVSITVWDHDDPYRYLEVEGIAELTEEGAGEHIDELSRRYEGKPFHTLTDRVIATIKPTRILDYGR